MPLVLADRVKDTTTTTGTGTVTLSGSPPTGFQSFAVVGDGNTTFYTITAGSEWEVGIGTYTSSGTTLARTTVTASSNAGSLVNFSAGVKDVFVTYPAERSVYTTATAELAIPAPGTLNNVLTSNGTSWVSQAGATASNVQTFSSSGTWTKPSGANFVLVETWGAGGGGGRPTAGATNPAGGGGGGGAYAYKWFLASALDATVPVTIGAGGTGATGNGNRGINGGTSSFGNIVYAYGGAGGYGNATVTTVQSGGGGGGAQQAATANRGGGPLISDFLAGSNIPAQISGGGSGALTVSAVTQVEGSSSTFGGGGGAGTATGSTAVSNGGGGSSVYGGGGGGAGGRSIAGGSAGGQQATRGGGPLATAISDSVSTFFGACGGGQPPIYGLTVTPEAFLGGGGGQATLASATVTPLDIAVNGSQTVILSQVQNNGFTYAALLVSSDGLATYTPYFTGKWARTAIGGIVFDGSKYVIAVLPNQEPFTVSNPITFFKNIYSTTDFINFTEHSLSGLSGVVGNAQISATFMFKYINGIYFLGASNDLYYSSDLNSWTRANVAGGTSVNITSIVYDGTFYYALRQTSVVYRSSNLSSWTSYSTGAGGELQGIAASPTVVVVTTTVGSSRYSTDQGATWSNLPTIPATQGRRVEYFAATGDWLMVTSGPAMYYTTTPTTSWTLSTASGLVSGSPIGYNGTRYILGGAASASIAAYTSTTAAGTFASQAFTAPSIAATPGGPGGIAGGGGGGAASSTTTTNGGAGGNGFCRVYTW